jgi:hypothetical protein
MKALNNHPRPLVFFLWGKSAQDWRHMITAKKHLVLSSPDPSPVSADNGFFGTYHFSAARAFSRDDYIDLRPFVDNLSTNSPMRNFLRELYKRKGIIFDESKAANLPVRIISPDIPNNTTIDLSLS